jgi:hypothetical protein
MIYKIKLPDRLRVFPEDEIVVGGQARLAVYCLVNKRSWPKDYTPRDKDYLQVAPFSFEKGIIGNNGSDSVDRLIVSSIEDYFDQIDLHTNSCAIENNSILICTDEALKCFVTNKVRMNRKNPGLMTWKVSAWEYIALRACVQTGWSIEDQMYYPRHGALMLHRSIKAQLYKRDLRQNWYWPTYVSKMLHIKTGKH